MDHTHTTVSAILVGKGGYSRFQVIYTIQDKNTLLSH